MQRLHSKLLFDHQLTEIQPHTCCLRTTVAASPSRTAIQRVHDRYLKSHVLWHSYVRHTHTHTSPTCRNEVSINCRLAGNAEKWHPVESIQLI